MTHVKTPAEFETYLEETILNFDDIYKAWPEVRAQLALIPAIHAAQLIDNASAVMMAESAKSMAKTMDTQRIDYKELVVDGREAIPKDLVFYMIKWICCATAIPCFVLSACVVIGVLYFTNYRLATTVERNRLDLAIGQNEVKQEVSAVLEKVSTDAEKREEKKGK